MSRVAIIAAMVNELKPLVRGWRRESRNRVDLWRRREGEDEWVAACAGAGAEAASRAFAEIEKDGPIDCVFSAGWAGALGGEFAAGRAYWITGVVDARTGERFCAAGRAGAGWLATSPRVAGRAEKRRLASTYGAGLVDMEAAAIARLAAMRGIPFYCVKGVSDGHADRLPDFNGFLSSAGEFQLFRFILFALLRPWHWPGLMRMAKNSKNAARAIRERLLVELGRALR